MDLDEDYLLKLTGLRKLDLEDSQNNLSSFAALSKLPPNCMIGLFGHLRRERRIIRDWRNSL